MIYLIRRFFAFYIDMVLVGIVCFIIFSLYNLHVYGSFDKVPNMSVNPLFFTSNIILVFYFYLFDIINKQTIGKKLMKFRIIGYENITFKERLIKSFIRNISRVIPFEPISILFDERYLTWHDKFSKTEVVDWRKK